MSISSHLLVNTELCLAHSYFQALHVLPYFTYLSLHLIDLPPVDWCPGYSWGRWSAFPMQPCYIGVYLYSGHPWDDCKVCLFQGENDTYLGLSQESFRGVLVIARDVGDTRSLISTLWGQSNVHASTHYILDSFQVVILVFLVLRYLTNTIQACTWHFFLDISFALLGRSFQRMPPNRLPWKLCGTYCISLLFLRINWLHSWHVYHNLCNYANTAG